jgi:hypothetical protein
MISLVVSVILTVYLIVELAIKIRDFPIVINLSDESTAISEVH